MTAVHHTTLVQGHGARAETQRHIDLMQRYQHGTAIALVDVGQGLHHPAYRFRVERSDRFVG